LSVGPGIELDRLSKRFQRAQVLDQVSLRVEPGERVALVGANGAGKTTLIRCLLGEYHHQGAVRVDGVAPRERRKDVLARVGFVPQIPPRLKMPVGELLRFSAGLCESRPERMLDVAQRLGFDAAAASSRAFARLSGGQQQKLLIAIAFGRDGDLLILDEPAANLDPEARQAFFELLATRARTATVLVSSHRLDEIAGLVDRVVEIDCGKVVLDDRVADVGLGRTFHCRVVLLRPDDAAEAVLASWGFARLDGGLEGSLDAADRLRFLGMIARYSGLLRELELTDRGDGS
jgi:ABC-2 type transport system ATP-binding protein